MSPEALCCLGLLADREGFEKLIELIEPARRAEFLTALAALAPMTTNELQERWAELRRAEHAALVRRCEEAFGCDRASRPPAAAGLLTAHAFPTH